MRKSALFTLLLAAAPAFAFGSKPEHSAVDVETKAEGDKLKLVFKPRPLEGMVINEEGPWKLEVKKADGLAFAKTTMTKDDIDFKTPGWTLATTAKPAKDAGEVEYAMTVFVCTKDKTQCFREVHDAKAAWKK